MEREIRRLKRGEKRWNVMTWILTIAIGVPTVLGCLACGGYLIYAL